MAARPRVDLATVLGLLFGLGFIGVAISLGGKISAFVDVPSILIVVGGTFAITTVCFSIPEIVRAQKVVLNAIMFRLADPTTEARVMLELAQKVRANGLLAIQSDVERLADPHARKIFMLAVDGVNPEALETIMRSDSANMVDRHQRTVSILRKSAEIAPAMGLIGTLIGLVQMLGNLSDPNAIGPAMAVALITTLYGAILAYTIFIPLAAKLERNSQAEFQLRRLYQASVLSVLKQENPRQLEVLLNTILPPGQRVSVFN
jgi:chemotaxis protein MotA